MSHWWHDLERMGKIGKPVFLYNRRIIHTQCRSLRKSLGSNWSLYYAMKANPSPEILRLMKESGDVDGIDVASSGELNAVISAGFIPSQISVTGPAKSQSFLRTLIDVGVGCICVESLDELKRIVQIGGMKQGGILLRINPKEEARAFQLKISGRAMPFGIDEEDLEPVCTYLAQHQDILPFRGIHVHAGSQCFGARGYARHVRVVLEIAKKVEATGFAVSMINIGGGLGYGNWLPEQKIDVKAMCAQLLQIHSEFDFDGKMRMEPGRFLVAPAGVYACRVQGVKRSRGTTFVILEGGTHHLYALRHEGYQKKKIWVENTKEREGILEQVQIVGALCTPVDRFGGTVDMVIPQIGDVLIFPNNGAYGLQMSPVNFLGHPLPEEKFFDF